MQEISLVEKLNYDYLKILNSKEYKTGIKKNSKEIKNINDLFFKINRKIHLRNINDTGKNYNFSKNDIELMDKFKLEEKKIVIYSCIAGKYDEIQEPLFTSNNIDYVMFSDCLLKSDIWKIKKIPKEILELNNSTLINRYIKFHPFELFGNEYDYSIYIDGNILVVSNLANMIALVNNKYGIAFHKHYARNCVYDEAKYCIYNKKGNKKAIRELINQYKIEKFPKNYGLVEAPIIISDLKSNVSNKIQNKIYEKLIESETYRDQLCIPFVLWKEGIKPCEISTLGENIHYNYKVRSIKHK